MLEPDPNQRAPSASTNGVDGFHKRRCRRHPFRKRREGLLREVLASWRRQHVYMTFSVLNERHPFIDEGSGSQAAEVKGLRDHSTGERYCRARQLWYLRCAGRGLKWARTRAGGGDGGGGGFSWRGFKPDNVQCQLRHRSSSIR